jgi:hypothetical protein
LLDQHKEAVEEVKDSTNNGCWRKLWPEVVNDRRIPSMYDVTAEIVATAPNKKSRKIT